MRGVQWSPATGLRCQDCGGYEVDLRADGTARCRTCGRVSVPRSPRRFAGTGRLAFALLGILLVVVVGEAFGSLAYTRGVGTAFFRTFSFLLFVTGFVALVVAGIGATPGRVAMRTQRLDRLSLLYPVQDPVLVGTLSPTASPRTAEEPGTGGILVLFAFGAALVAGGYLLSLA